MARLGLDYPTAWGRQPPARLARRILQGVFLAPYVRIVSHLDVRGLENLRETRTFILVANHTSNLDTPLVLSALPARVRERTVVAAAMDNFFMTTRKAFRTVLIFNAIPVDRHRVNRRSSQLALELVESDWNLLIYPEGGRTPDGQLREFKGGAAYLAERAAAPVIPVYIHGAGALRGPKYAKAPQFVNAPNRLYGHVTIAFGEALRCGSDENIRRFNTRIEDAVVELGRAVSGDPGYGITRATD